MDGPTPHPHETTGLLLVRIGCPTRADARKIGAALIDAGLTEVFHAFPIDATYRWKGEIADASEIALEVRLPRAAFAAACTVVEGLHPYEIPSIIGIDIAMTTGPYADWLARSAT